MKWRLQEFLYRSGRTQLAVAVLMLAVFGGYLVTATPDPAPPIRVGTAPAQKPLAPHVRSAATVIPVDCAKVPCMALTFDDGPNAEVTPQVLDILDRHHVRATFFLIGLHVPGNEELVRRMHQAGHEIGNHSWSHRELTKLSPEEIEQEVTKTQQAIAAAGVPLPRLFRAPYGDVNPMVRSHIPLTILSWNVDPEDWKARKSDKIVNHVLEHAKPGAIVDLHDIRQPTADALDPILTNLEQTYHLVTVSELLNLSSGQPGIFYGR